MHFTKGCFVTAGIVILVILVASIITYTVNKSDDGSTQTASQTTTSTSSTTTGTPPREEVELAVASNQGLIQFSIIGQDTIDRVSLTITSTSEKDLKVIISPGTMFLGSGGVQNMVVILIKEILLNANASKTVDVYTACANMHLDVPAGTNYFQLSSEPIPEDLQKLLALADFVIYEFRVKQFAIWTITDNPQRNGYVGIGSYGMASGPTDDEIATIKTMFQEAGISISNYQALN